MLTLGILYGSSRQKLNQATEDAFRAKEEEERPAREAAMKAAKEKASRGQIFIIFRISETCTCMWIILT